MNTPVLAVRLLLVFAVVLGLATSTRGAFAQSGVPATPPTAASTPAQDSIVLRASATIDRVRDVTLADVAAVSGAEASRYLASVILPVSKLGTLSSGGSLAVDVATVRQALSAAGLRWGKVTLSGGTCKVALGTAVKAAPVTERPIAPGTTVRDHVRTRLAQELGVGPAELELSFDADPTKLLDVPTEGRSVAVTPTGSSERVPVSIRVYEDAKLIAEGSIRVGVKVRRVVMVSRGAISRGSRIADADMVQEVRWVSPTAGPAGVDAVIGAAARNSIPAGAMVQARDVETPAVVRKGDLLAVDSVVGGVVIRMNNARALQDGRDGEEILVEQASSLASTEKQNGRRGKPGTVRVLVTGPGRAVVAGS